MRIRKTGFDIRDLIGFGKDNPVLEFGIMLGVDLFFIFSILITIIYYSGKEIH